MEKFNYQEFNKRYEKFKKNNLPTPFWDEERQVMEYVCYDEENLQVYNEISYGLEDMTLASLYYPFIDKHVESHKEGKKEIFNVVVGHNHAHSFEDVLRALYYSPESFRIEKKDYEYYSNNELQYLKRIQNYLLLIGLKDKGSDRLSVSRFRNKLHKKYSDCRYMQMNSKNIERLIKGKIDFRVTKYYQGYNAEEFKPYKALIIDENDNFRLYVDVIATKIKKRKDIKGYYFSNKLKDTNKVIVYYINVLELL